MTESVDRAGRPLPLTNPDARDRVAQRDRWRGWLLRWGPLVLLALFLLPSRADALRGDDEWNFDTRGLMLLHHTSLWSEIWTSTSNGLNHGRPEFLGALTTIPVLDLFDAHPTEYHLYLIALTVLCGALLWSLVRALTNSARLAALTAVMFAGALQFHFYHDALLGYYGGTQIAVAFLLASLLTHVKALHAERRELWWTLATAVLFIGACGMEQWMDLLMTVHVCLGLVEMRNWRMVRTAAPAVLIGLAFLIVGAVGAPLQDSTGYTTGLSVPTYLYTFARSLVAPLPTSNRLFSQGTVTDWVSVFPLGGSPTAAEWLAALWRGAVVFAVTLAFCRWPGRWRTQSPSVSRAAMRLVAVGAPLYLVSPLLVVVAAKYQVDITLSRGYIEGFAQTIGVVLMIAAMLVWLLERLRSRAPSAGLILGGCAAALFGVAAGVDGFNDIRIVALEQPVRHTRDLLENAAKSGFLDSIPQRSTLLFSALDMNWYTGSWAYVPGSAGAILYADSDRLYDARVDADTSPLNCAAGPPTEFPPSPCAPPLASSWWVRVRATLPGGAVIAARIPHPTPTTYLNAAATRIIVYAQESGTSDPHPPVIYGVHADGKSWSSAGLHFQRLRGSGDWAVFAANVHAADAPKAQSLTILQSTVNFLQLPPADTLAREFGTKELLP